MGFSAKLVRSQLNFFKPLVANCSLETIRKGQDKLGELMEAIHKKDVIVRDEAFANFEGAWIMPRDERRQGIILYLHGGGYTCGDLDYAKGFGATLADELGVRVFCAAYRLAPEHPYPAALEDAMEAYSYLISRGYGNDSIMLAGESAGGGLCFALCLKLKSLGLPLPSGIIAISPWADLTATAESYTLNREHDPSLTKEVLEFYADCYARGSSLKDPLISPLFGELEGMPPSIIFAGSDELLLDDAKGLYNKLTAALCESRLIVAPERWHAYVLYQLNENEGDMDAINAFVNKHLSQERKLRWLRLDNAAKIYPAARRRNWNNFFRLSATLDEAVDREVLQSALDVTVRRFPSIAVRLRRGAFWYYLEQLQKAPRITEEKPCPLAHVPFKQVRECAFRVIAYKNRIAVEFFHAVTDGTGALIFLKTLVAEYLTQKYALSIPDEHGVLSRLSAPSEAELEDSFLKYSGAVSASRRENTAYHLSGTPEKDGFLNLVTLMLDTASVREKAREHGVSVTEFLCAAMMQAILELQAGKVRNRRLRKPVKVLVPVNLRNLFPSETLRNFAQYITPEVDSRLGEYTFDEICTLVHHTMGLEYTAKLMSARIATNVNSEKAFLLKIMPLFIKNIAMKAVFNAVGERKSCLCLSNLGNAELPEPMRSRVKRMDFIIGVQARAPHNCGITSYDGTMYINMIRNIKEPELELHFFRVLRRLGLGARVESNQP